MPIAKRGARGLLTRRQVWQHLTGYDFFGGGYGDPVFGTVDERAMQRDWRSSADQIRDFRKDDRIRSKWPIYSELRFDQGMSHEEAIAAMAAAR